MRKEIKYISAIAGGILIIILSNVFAHYRPSFAILWTPVIMTVIIAGINYPLYKADFKSTVVYNFGLLIFNDLLTRFPEGVPVVNEERRWLFPFFVITFLIALLTMMIYAYLLGSMNNRGMRSKRENIISVIISAIAIGFVYILFIVNY